ncbi:MAG: cytochrome c biogenesis protein CcdA [bacterium]|nr:cytochrome c biogenesis protein CcdA [bacterium]
MPRSSSKTSQPNATQLPIGRWVLVSAVIIVLLVLFAPAPQGSVVSGVLRISILAAFFGGVFSLLSPCSAALIPAFFAYSFKEKSQLVKMTFVFWLGLATLFVPLGFSAGLLAKLFITQGTILYYIAGGIFLIIGLMSLLNKSFNFHVQGPNLAGKRGAGTVYLMGILFAFASGTCAAPVIGGIFALASTQGETLHAILLLLVYSLGLVVPLLLIAWFFDRSNFAQSKLVRGKELAIPLGFTTWKIHTSNLIVGLLFLAIGILFITTRGTTSLLLLFRAGGLMELYYDINEWLLTAAPMIPAWALGVVFAAAGLLWYFLNRRRKQK